jgi:hypothetical protein
MELFHEEVASDFWRSETKVAEIKASNSVKIVISECVGMDRSKHINIREWFHKNSFEDGEYRPAKNGYVIPVNEIGDNLIEVINKAYEEMKNE